MGIYTLLKIINFTESQILTKPYQNINNDFMFLTFAYENR